MRTLRTALLAIVAGLAIGGSAAIAQNKPGGYNAPSKIVQATQISPSTGTGSVVLNTSPTLVTPALGAATATSINFGGSTLSTYSTASTAMTFTFNGSGGTTGSVNVLTARIGDFVFVKIPQAQATSGTSSTEADSTANLPAGFRPTTSADSCNVPIKNNNAASATPGCVRVLTTGQIILFKDNSQAAFTNAANAGTQADFNFVFSIN